MRLPGSIPLYTRMRREVPNAQLPDLPPANAERAIDGHAKKHPMAQLRRRPTGQYNFHGLTFANRRTCVHDPGSVEVILKDDGYREILPSEVYVGDLVVYYDGTEITHTGVVMAIERDNVLVGAQAVWAMSKWGQAGEYIHPVNQGPYSTHRLTYWTDRVKR